MPLGIKTNTKILCFWSLGTVHENVRENLIGLGLTSEGRSLRWNGAVYLIWYVETLYGETDVKAFTDRLEICFYEYAWQTFDVETF